MGDLSWLLLCIGKEATELCHSEHSASGVKNLKQKARDSSYSAYRPRFGMTWLSFWMERSEMKNLLRSEYMARDLSHSFEMRVMSFWGAEHRRISFADVEDGGFSHRFRGGICCSVHFSVPDCFVRSARKSNDLIQLLYRPVADSLHLSTGKHMVCLYSARCSFCKATAQKVAAIARRHHLSDNEVRCLFIQTEENMQPSVPSEKSRNGG